MRPLNSLFIPLRATGFNAILKSKLCETKTSLLTANRSLLIPNYTLDISPDWSEERAVSYESGSFPYQQLPRRRKITGGKGIEIRTTRNAFTKRVSAVPIRRAALAVIHTRRLMS